MSPVSPVLCLKYYYLLLLMESKNKLTLKYNDETKKGLLGAGVKKRFLGGAQNGFNSPSS